MASRKAAGIAPIADEVHQTLLNQFMDGSRPPGQPLNIATLSRELDVSQTPIREALARLEHTGLVQREARKGYRVAAPLSSDDLTALMAARSILEPELAKAAARNTTAEFLATLGETIERLENPPPESEATDSYLAYWQADDQFHVAIAEQTGNKFLAAAYGALGVQVQRIRHFHYDTTFAVAEHRAILAALEAGDSALASEAMLRHLQAAAERAIRDRIADHSDEPVPVS